VSVRQIAAHETQLWAETSAAGWSEFVEFAPLILDLAQLSAARQGGGAFLAELDGQAIATGSLVLHEGVALLAGASTIPSARQQGAQAALLRSRLQFAAEQGCDLAMMCAAPGSASQRNAERQGFRIAYTRIKWALGGDGTNGSHRTDGTDAKSDDGLR
jgi:GNAT superfamily N-acetyltransferase